jgi:radical SAM superfamily enzyme YgiQ (UPF0313 family)
MKIKLIGINARYSHSCLALFYLRNELEKHLPGVQTRICQYTINDPSFTLFQRIAEPGIDYFFFSALIWNSDLIEQVVEDLLAVDLSCHIVVGGPQAEVVASRFADDQRVSAFIGDIEAAGPQFYEDLAQTRLDKRYQASFFGAAPLSGPHRIGFPYRPEDFSAQLKNRAIYYESSRGCPFFCTYCLSSSQTGLYHKDLDEVFAELEEILSHNPATVRFVDRTFNDIPARALKIWEFIRDQDPDTLFHFEIAPDRFTPELFCFLESIRAGLFQFEIGIQSTNPQTLEAIRRPIKPQPAARVIRKLRSLETIHLHADLILGLPYETASSFRVSLNDVFAMRPHYIQMGLLKLLPETEIRRQAGHYRFRACSRPPYTVLANRWLGPAELQELYWLGECLERCVNNRYFVSLWSYLGQAGEDMARFFSALAKRFFEQGYFWKAVTQEILSRLLLEECSCREDFELIRELICYDWLRCGHRFLPHQLCYAQPSIDELRRTLYGRLPEELTGVYDRKTRKVFLKKSVFHHFSTQAMRWVGHQIEDNIGTATTLVCFLSERESRVHRFNKVILLKNSD